MLTYILLFAAFLFGSGLFYIGLRIEKELKRRQKLKEVH